MSFNKNYLFEIATNDFITTMNYEISFIFTHEFLIDLYLKD